MNTAERLAMIRARLQKPTSAVSKPAGMHRAEHPDVPQTTLRKPYSRNEAGYRIYSYSVGGDYCPTSDNRPPWVYHPNKQKPIQCSVGRTKRMHYLTKIEQKWGRIKSPHQEPEPSNFGR